MARSSLAEWQAALESARKLVDGMGMPVDSSILETVAILRVLGINTVASCEGHVDRGYGPYVSFEAVDAETDRRRLAEAKRDSGQTGNASRTIITKMSQDDIAERRKLFPYLDEFYKASKKPQTERLIVENLGFCAAVLRPQNASLIGKPSGEPLRRRKELLRAGQQEMQDFTEFLKAAIVEWGGSA